MKIIYFLIPLFLFFACTETQEPSEVDKLKAVVMKIHDEVMPKNSVINKTSRALREITKDSTLSDSTLAVIRTQIKQLTAAEEAMFDWMAKYKAPTKEVPLEIAILYLDNEKKEISKVRDMMLTSLDNGTKLLNSFKIKEQKIKQD